MVLPLAPSADTLPSRYDRHSVTLHWITALLVVLLWSLGQAIDWFPKGAPRIAARSTHITLGALLFVVLVWRMSWRARSAARTPASAAGWLGAAATLSHGALYLLLISTVLLGIANLWVRGDTVFNLFTMPKLNLADPDLKSTVEDLHALSANVLLIVACLHAAMGLMHHFWLRDDVLRRMLPRRSDA